MTRFADLHIHTHYSDGNYSPQEVVQEALEAGLVCISITDHDTIEGIEPTLKEGQIFDLEIIPGVELSSRWEDKDIHILGYFIDYSNETLHERLKEIQESRISRIAAMIEKLRNRGIEDIHCRDVCRFARSKLVGRLHLANVLLQKGLVSSIEEAFKKYIGENCFAFVEKSVFSVYKAIELIKGCGGVAVLAHPMLIGKDELIPSLVEAGLEGLEVYYPNCSDSVLNYYEGIAKKYNLIVTGGSDAHGTAKKNTYVGKTKIPYEMVDKLKGRHHFLRTNN